MYVTLDVRRGSSQGFRVENGMWSRVSLRIYTYSCVHIYPWCFNGGHLKLVIKWILTKNIAKHIVVLCIYV